MLRKIYLLSALLALSTLLSAQSWMNLGQAKPDTGYANICDITSDTSGRAMIAYSDGSLNRQVSVMQFANGNWNYLGPKAFTWANVVIPKLLVTASNQIYLTAWFSNGNIKVYRYKPAINDWEGVAFNLATGVTDQYITTCADDSENVYVAFHDEGLDGKVVVKKFDGLNWSDYYLTDTTATYPAIAYSKTTGKVYLAYRNTNLVPAYASVVDCSNGNFVGSNNISTDAADNIGLAVKSNGNIYISYNSLSVNTKSLEVKYYDGTSWLSTPSTGVSSTLSSGWLTLTNLLILPDNSVLIATHKTDGTSKVYKLGTSSSWSDIGTYSGSKEISLGASKQVPLFAYCYSNYPYKFSAYSYGCYEAGHLQIIGPDSPVCAGSFVSLTAINTDGNNAPNWYINNSQVASGTIYNGIINATTTITAKSYRNCSSGFETASLTVYADNPYLATITNLTGNNICRGDSAKFIANSNLHTVTSYHWFKNGIAVSGNSQTYMDSTLRDGDKISCSVQGQSCLGQVFLPTSTITIHVTDSVASVQHSSNLPLCAGDSVNLYVTPAGMQYSWNTGDTSQSITVTQAGLYSVSYLQAGCQASAKIMVDVVSDTLPVAFTNSETHFCNGDTIALALSQPYPSMLWNTGDTTASISVSTSGTYSVSVNQGICSGTASLNLTFDSLATLPISFLNDTLNACIGDTIIISPFESFNHYSWSTGETNASINVVETGNYLIAVERNGCSATDSVMVMFNALDTPVIYTGGNGSYLCTAPGVSLYTDTIYDTYQWSTGITTPGIMAINPGIYMLTVTSGSCSSKAEIVVSNYIPTQLNVTPNYISNGLTDMKVSPGGADIYFWEVRWNGWNSSPVIDQFSLDRDSIRIYCDFYWANYHNGEISDWVVNQGYFLKVTASKNGCLDTSVYFTNNNCITSLHEIPNSPKVILYPNPSSSSVTISFAEAGEQPVKLEILDLQGRLIQTTDLSASANYGQYSLNISHLPNGFYFARVWIGPEVSTLKLEKVD